MHTTFDNDHEPVTSHWQALDFAAVTAEYPPAPGFYDAIAHLSRDAIRNLQEQRFLAVVASTWKIPFYSRLWRAAGLEPGDIRALEDITRLPIFTIKDLRDSIERKPPFGDYMGISPVDARHVPLVLVTSGGTTGLPRPMLYAPREREIMTIIRARSLHMHGVRPGDLVQVTMALGLSNGGVGTRDALLRYNGALAISTGSGNSTPSRRQIEIARSLGTNVILGFPSYLRHLGLVARDELNIDPRDLRIKVLGSHLGTEDRKPIEAMWGCRCLDSYGCHEVGHVASECRHGDGMHVFEDAVIAEIIDRETGKPASDGASGSVVLTSLYRFDVPFIRYNINDVSAFRTGTCACGRTLPRMDRILGRGDTMVKLRGVNVFPEAIGAVVGADARTNGEFFCTVERVGAEGRDEMTVRVEVLSPTDASIACDEIEQRLKGVLGVKVAVCPAAPGELARDTGMTQTSKPKRLIDKRA